MIDNKITVAGTVTWLVCTLFFMYDFFLRTVLGTFQPQLMHELHLSSVQFALLSSTIFQVIYGMVQIPAGLVINHLGIKKTLIIAILLCTVATLGFSVSYNFTSAMLCRMLMGLGASCGFICLLIAIYDWMPRKNIAFFIGISQFLGTMGPMLSAGPLSSFVSRAGIGWRSILFDLMLIGVAISILILLYVKKNRQQGGKFIILSRGSTIASSLSPLIKIKQIWFIALYSAFAYFSIEYLTNNEGVSFLIKKGFTSTFSSYMITISWLGYAISCPLMGYFSDKIQRRKPFMLSSAVILLLSLTTITYLPVNALVLTLCFALLGIGASGSSIGFAIMVEQCNEDSIGAGLGLNNSLILLVSAMNAPLIGYLLTHNTAHHSLQLFHYQQAFMVMPLFAIGAIALVVFYIKETFCKSTCNNTILNLQETQSSTNVFIPKG